MAPATQQTKRPRADSGVFKRLELERSLRGLTAAELRELVDAGAFAELLDVEPPEDDWEY